jgi:hypothetical protein
MIGEDNVFSYRHFEAATAGAGQGCVDNLQGDLVQHSA